MEIMRYKIDFRGVQAVTSAFICLEIKFLDDDKAKSLFYL